ncbi:hypothetical protein [Roseimicrobium gellanilyticum]|nr:hypothetical protein [Roseimicrobium gellanilyticum]
MLSIHRLPPGETPAADTPRWQQMLNPDGTWSVLKLEGADPISKEAKAKLAIPKGHVRWAAILPPGLAEQAEGGVQLIGNLQSDPPAVEECSPLRQQAPLLPAPPGVNLVRNLEFTTFGVEERVQEKATGSDTPSWTMKPGTRPAGLYAARSWRLPVLAGKEPWILQVVARGEGKIRTGLAFDNGAGFGDATILETLELKGADTAFSLKLPKTLAEAKQLRVVLLAPDDHAADLHVSSISFQQGPGGGASKPVNTELGVWNWSTKPEEWRRLKPVWKQAGVKVLQLALPRELQHGAEGPLPALSDLRKEDFQIVAVEGDPHMILPQEKSSVVARHQQLTALHGKYLDGIQYDVEPYLLPGFRLEPELWHQHWLQMYEALTPGKAPLRVEPVVPFWLIAQPAAQKLLKGLAPRSTRVVVMNYRSDAGDAAAWATSWLEWSVQHQCPVALAVECGPVPDLESATYRKAPRGPLWLKSWPGHGTVAVIFDGEVDPGADATTFALARQGTVSGAATSLQGQDPTHVAEWLQTMRDISQRLNLPAKLIPRLLLHEPKEELLRYLGERAQ